MGPIVLASCLSLAPYFLEFDLERYTELVECYRQGEYLESARALSERPLEKIREFASEFRSSPRSDLDLQAAALLHTEVIRWFKQDELTHFELATLHVASMSDDEWRDLFAKNLRLALGYLYFSQLRLPEAEALFRSDEEPPPRDRDFGYALGTLQEAMVLTSSGGGSWEAAELEYRWMLEERPDHAELQVRLGHVLWRLGRVEESRAELEAHLPDVSEGQEPARLVGHLVLGEIYQSRGETEKSLAHFRSAHALDPDCQAASAALGLALATAGRDAEATAITAAFLDSGGHDSVTDDTWWQYILGPALGHSALFSELQKEVRYPR